MKSAQFNTLENKGTVPENLWTNKVIFQGKNPPTRIRSSKVNKTFDISLSIKGRGKTMTNYTEKPRNKPYSLIS